MTIKESLCTLELRRRIILFCIISMGLGYLSPCRRILPRLKSFCPAWEGNNVSLAFPQPNLYLIDNNRAERAIKPFTCGRKNWLFANCVEGANTSAKIFSLIETAKAHELNPIAYFTYLFKELPKCHTLESYEALLPFNIKKKELEIST